MPSIGGGCIPNTTKRMMGSLIGGSGAVKAVPLSKSDYMSERAGTHLVDR